MCTPGRLEDILMGKTSGHKEIGVANGLKALVSYLLLRQKQQSSHLQQVFFLFFVVHLSCHHIAGFSV